MRISDWSSDVCSSDLVDTADVLAVEAGLVGDRADDVARLDVVCAADRDAVGLHAGFRCAARPRCTGRTFRRAFGAFRTPLEISARGCGGALSWSRFDESRVGDEGVRTGSARGSPR